MNSKTWVAFFLTQVIIFCITNVVKRNQSYRILRNPNTIGGRIFLLRKYYNLSLTELSTLSGVSAPTISILETSGGKVFSQLFTVQKIAKALNVSTNYLIEGTKGEQDFVVVNAEAKSLQKMLTETEEKDQLDKKIDKYQGMNRHKFFLAKEVCALLDVSDITLNKWRHSKADQLPFVRHAGLIFYKRSDVRKFKKTYRKWGHSSAKK